MGKSCLLSGDEKIHTLQNKITCRSVESIFSKHELNDTMLSLTEDFVTVPFDKAANNMIFICKHLYAVTIIKEVNHGIHISTRTVITPTHS